MMAAGGGAESLLGCGQHLASKRYPTKITDFELIAGFDTYRIGDPAGHAVVLLHELPGLSPDDLALAHAIGERGFNVFVPRLFGKVAVIEIPDAKGHSTLAGDQDPRALDDAVNYISVRVKAATGPKPMTLAQLQGQLCVIDAAGNWSATTISHPVANR
jgi:hypothetical protein